jgi:hypothetical protein
MRVYSLHCKILTSIDSRYLPSGICVSECASPSLDKLSLIHALSCLEELGEIGDSREDW